MVKRIVEQAGGSVRFESREEEGTTFFVVLPLVFLRARRSANAHALLNSETAPLVLLIHPYNLLPLRRAQGDSERNMPHENLLIADADSIRTITINRPDQSERAEPRHHRRARPGLGGCRQRPQRARAH